MELRRTNIPMIPKSCWNTFWRFGLIMESLRESILHLTFQMSTYKRATLDEEELLDTGSDGIYHTSTMQVRVLFLFNYFYNLSFLMCVYWHIRQSIELAIIFKPNSSKTTNLKWFQWKTRTVSQVTSSWFSCQTSAMC